MNPGFNLVFLLTATSFWLRSCHIINDECTMLCVVVHWGVYLSRKDHDVQRRKSLELKMGCTLFFSVGSRLLSEPTNSKPLVNAVKHTAALFPWDKAYTQLICNSKFILKYCNGDRIHVNIIGFSHASGVALWITKSLCGPVCKT